MTKTTTCDLFISKGVKCNKIIPDGERSSVVLKRRRDVSSYYDICTEHAKEIREFILKEELPSHLNLRLHLQRKRMEKVAQWLYINYSGNKDADYWNSDAWNKEPGDIKASYLETALKFINFMGYTEEEKE